MSVAVGVRSRKLPVLAGTAPGASPACPPLQRQLSGRLLDLPRRGKYPRCSRTPWDDDIKQCRIPSQEAHFATISALVARVRVLVRAYPSDRSCTPAHMQRTNNIEVVLCFPSDNVGFGLPEVRWNVARGTPSSSGGGLGLGRNQLNRLRPIYRPMLINLCSAP